MKTMTLYTFNLTTAQGVDKTVCQTYVSKEAARAAVIRDYPNCTIWTMDAVELMNVNIHDMKTGDLVFMGMALFEVKQDYTVERDAEDLKHGYSDERGVAVRLADWVKGWIEPGYYGPGKVWNFQGNHRVTHWIVVR